MHVLVATDGNLDPEAVTGFTAPLAGPDGKVTVLAVIAIPRRLLSEMRGVFGERRAPDVDGDAEYVGMTTESGAAPVGWPGDTKMIERYLSDKKKQRCAPLAEALEAAGVTVETNVIESERISETAAAATSRRDGGDQCHRERKDLENDHRGGDAARRRSARDRLARRRPIRGSTRFDRLQDRASCHDSAASPARQVSLVLTPARGVPHP